MDKYQILREAAEADFETYVKLIRPDLALGPIHSELFKWITAPERKKHKLVMLPREHYKSGTGALYATWRITCNPAIRILYLSSTSNLATKQLKAIKDILTSDLYRLFWPEMVNLEEAKREKWSESEISVDHPKRRKENVRDPTVFTAGLTTSITGLHCDLCIPDDVVVYENAYTEEGRQKTALQYSLLAAVESTGADELVLGTRYHPKDLYGSIKVRKIQNVDQDGNVVSEDPLYDIFERVVEDKGDGTGTYIWPRNQREDGQWFGFNQSVLAIKKAQFSDLTQFYAQYYNNPNVGENSAIPKNCFQYYDKEWLKQLGGLWHYKDRRLNIFAAMDFAYTVKKGSDFSSIVVVGIDCFNNHYVLDIDRYKTGLIDVYYDHLFKMYAKWGFHKVVAECTAAQEVIVNDLKVNYIRPNGLALTIDTYKPNRYEGAKYERIDATLRPRYTNGQMWHFLGGNIDLLEEELQLVFPPHDDIKDALTTAVNACIAPIDQRMHNYNHYQLQDYSNRRFGGIT